MDKNENKNKNRKEDEKYERLRFTIINKISWEEFLSRHRNLVFPGRITSGESPGSLVACEAKRNIGKI